MGFGNKAEVAKLAPNEEAGELTQLLLRIQNSRDEEACTRLWESVYENIVAFARNRIAVRNQRVADEEDIALSAMNSFFRAAEAGRFKSLTNSDELWRVLITLVARKSHAFHQRQAAEKRGEGLVRGDSVFSLAGQDRPDGLNALPDTADPHRFVDELLGECRDRIESLPDEVLQTIAVRRMEGFEVNEIATELNLSVATIKRKLARIRDLWSEDAPG